MIIKKILLNKNNGQKLIYVPTKCELKEGDYVQLIKIQENVPQCRSNTTFK